MGISTAQLMHLAGPLGWTLLHSLWQGAAVAAALAVALAALRGRSPQARYVVSLAALGLIVLAAAITFERATPRADLQASVPSPPPVTVLASSPTIQPSHAIFPQGPAPTARVTPAPADAEPQITFRVSPASPGAAPAPECLKARVDRMLPWLSAAWAAGVALLSLWHLAGWIAAQRLRVLGIQVPDESLIMLAAEVAGRLGFDKPVRVVVSLLAQTPMVIGWIRPMVLLPAAVATGLTPAQIEGILAHELAHIRRHDYLINLFQVVAETLLFYHPAVWWISRRVRLEREQCCDAIAVRACGDRCGYAESLAMVEQVRLGQSLALAAAGGGRGEMLWRVRTILGLNDEAPRQTARVCVAAIILLIIAAVPFSLSHTAPAASTVPPAVAPASQPAAGSATLEGPDMGKRAAAIQRMAEALNATYAPANQETLRLIRGPFSDLRTRLVEENYGASNPAGVRAVVFHVRNGRVYPGAWSYGGLTLNLLVSDLGLRWDQVDHDSFKQVHWPAGLAADVVIRDDATLDQKLAAVAALIKRETGQKVTVGKVRRTLPCIVLHGKTARPGYASISAEGRGEYAAFVTAQTLDDATLARYAQKLTLRGPMGRPKDTGRGGIDFLTSNLGAPFIHEGGSDGQFWRTGTFFIFNDVAGWHPTDANYADKVRRVLDNLQKQLGGDWRLENREVEQYALQPAAGEPISPERPATRPSPAPRLQFRIEAKPDEGGQTSELKDPASGQAYRFRTDVVLSEADVRSAREQPMPEGELAVDVDFTDAGSGKLLKVTSDNVNRRLAILFDGRVLSMPVIHAPISHSAMITGGSGGMTREQVNALVDAVRSTAAPLPTTRPATQPAREPARALMYRVGDPQTPRDQRSVVMFKGNSERIESPNGAVFVYDPVGHQMMALDPTLKTATISKLLGAPPRQPTAADLERMADPGHITVASLGTKQVGGQEASGIQFSVGPETRTVWRSKATGEPVQIELDLPPMPPQVEHAVHVVYSDIDFNAALDDSLFAVKAPAGFAGRKGNDVRLETEVIRLPATRPAPATPGEAPPPATKPAATSAPGLVTECVLSGIVDGQRKVLAKPTFQDVMGSEVRFVYPGKLPIIVGQAPGNEAGIRAQVRADPQPDGRIRVFCRLQDAQATSTGNRAGLDETLLAAHAQNLLAMQRNLSEAQHMLDLAQQDLEHRRLGLHGMEPYTADEISRVDPTLLAKINARNEQQILSDEMASRYGPKYPQTVEARHLLELRQKDIVDSVNRFNQQYFIVQGAAGTPRMLSKDLTKLRQVVAEYQRAYDLENEQLKKLDHAGGSETDQVVKIGEPVAVELADGTRLEVTVAADEHANVLAPGDLIDVQIRAFAPQGRKTTLEQHVGSNGAVPLPLVGDVNVAGKSLADAAKAIDEAYAKADLIRKAGAVVTIVKSGQPTRPLAPGDRVRMRLWDYPQPNETRTYDVVVTTAGSIPAPEVGDIKIAGMTESQAMEAIAKDFEKAGLIAHLAVLVTRTDAPSPKP